MAGDWIKIRGDLFTHPKVVRMASALKADTLRTVGGLTSVWCLFDAHSEDGYLDGYTVEVLDDYLRWEGFSAAMIAVCWLEESADGGLNLPRFDSHNGQSAKRRAQDSERKRLARGVEKEGDKPVRKMSASEADETRTREEKRREDISTTNVVDGGAKKSRATRKCPEAFDLSDAMREWAVENAPAVDVDLATAKFRDHTFKNAISDWPAAWRNWLRNEQDFANQRRPAPAAAAPIRESFRERDERLARKKYEAITGKTHPDNLPAFDGVFGGVIDVTPAAHELEFKP